MACSEWSLSRSLWKKVHQLEKSTPAVLVALVTNHSYGCTRPQGSTLIPSYKISHAMNSSVEVLVNSQNFQKK